MKNLFDLTGKTAIVTGASVGLGEDGAEAYAAAGADVVILACRQENPGPLIGRLKDGGGRVRLLICDFGDDESIKLSVDRVLEEYGKIDILHNNVEVPVLRGSSPAQGKLLIFENLRSIRSVSEIVISHMKDQRFGKVINTVSPVHLSGRGTDLWESRAYESLRSAVLHLTKGMAAVYGRYNITVNTVEPGSFASEIRKRTSFKTGEFLKMINAVTDEKNREINGPLIFLASDASDHVNGQVLFLNRELTTA